MSIDISTARSIHPLQYVSPQKNKISISSHPPALHTHTHIQMSLSTPLLLSHTVSPGTAEEQHTHPPHTHTHTNVHRYEKTHKPPSSAHSRSHTYSESMTASQSVSPDTAEKQRARKTQSNCLKHEINRKNDKKNHRDQVLLHFRLYAYARV